MTNTITYVDKDGVIRFRSTDDKNKLREQLKEFEKSAKEGKIICISDLIGNAESAYIKNLRR